MVLGFNAVRLFGYSVVLFLGLRVDMIFWSRHFMGLFWQCAVSAASPPFGDNK
jgi:hypothetical protein